MSLSLWFSRMIFLRKLWIFFKIMHELFQAYLQFLIHPAHTDGVKMELSPVHPIARPERLFYHANLSNSTIDALAKRIYVPLVSRPDGRRDPSGGKSGLHGDTVPDNFRRGQP